MIKRSLYIDQIKGFIGKPFIKVITGIRRSGKSVMLMLIRDELKGRGVDESHIIYINFESFEFANLTEATALYAYVREKAAGKGQYFLLFDEIQEVKAWEKAINSIRVDFDTDIYITGSNSHLLSSELATYLSGRYIQFTIYTLSFSEYLVFRKEYGGIALDDIYSEFENYLRMGGFPSVHTGDYSREQVYQIVYDIYSSVILRDVVQRYKIRDIELLERIVNFVFDNLGNKFSAKNVADYFKSQNRKLDINTVYNYLNALERSYIILRVNRYDIRGREILKTNEKYFTSDPSLLYALMGYRDRMISGVLENIMLLELKRRGYRVYIGKLADLEVDFIAEKGNKKIYIQVAYSIQDEETVRREFRPFLKIRDNYPKYVVTMDRVWQDNVDGVEHFHVAEFLLNVLN